MKHPARLLPYLFLLCLLVPMLPSAWRPHLRISGHVAAVLDGVIPALIGVVFVALGVLKVYGWKKGIVGGGDASASCRLLGRCPSWSKQLNIAFVAAFLAIGVVGLSVCLAVLLKQ